jgi:hypothetical protein
MSDISMDQILDEAFAAVIPQTKRTDGAKPAKKAREIKTVTVQNRAVSSTQVPIKREISLPKEPWA